MIVEPYLFFEGRCEEAIEFYRKALGAELLFLMRYKEHPDAGTTSPNMPGDKVMHASLRIGETVMLLSDGHCERQPDFQGFGLALTASSEAEADKIFGALSNGGEVRMPLEKTFFSPRFGMVTDRFGVLWMVLVAQEGGRHSAKKQGTKKSGKERSA